MQRIGFISLWALVLAFPELPSAAAGPPPKPLKLKIRPIIPLARSQSPQTFEVELACDSPDLFQGHLELKFYLEKRLLHDFITPDLAVTAGGHRFRIVLPPLVVRSPDKVSLLAFGRFVMERQAIDFEEQVFSVPAVWKRSFVVADVRPQEMLIPQAKGGLIDSLRFEQFNPFGPLASQAELQKDLSSYPSRLTPDDFPSTALGYACFDLLLLEGEGLQRLRPRQLSAIGDWTFAGGSIVVAPEGKLTADHVDFLNRLAGSIPGGDLERRAKPAAYSLNERGWLEVGEQIPAPGQKFTRLTCGLGRVLLIHEQLDPEVDFKTPEWKAAVAFLWKIRESQIEPIVRNGVWNFPAQNRLARFGAFRPYAPLREELPRDIRQFLLPERIEGVPLWVVVTILALYLVAIAPGDYFLLGRLNCRKYTWILFVLTSAAFTACTVMIAERYMGHADYRTTLVFADLADEGELSGAVSNGADSRRSARLARVSRFEMLFSATQRLIEIPVRNALYVDITDRAVLPEASQRDRRAFVFSEDDDMDLTDAVAADLPVYAGLMPHAFHIQQQMRQWSPRVNRQTSIGDNPELLAETSVDWKALRPDEWKTPAGRQSLRDAVLAREPAARVLLLRGNACFDLVGGSVVDLPRPGQPNFGSTRDSPLASLVRSASVRPETGLFAVVSQISPTGGEFLEDLALLDGGDLEQWLLAVIVRRDNNWLVFRKLFRGRRP